MTKVVFAMTHPGDKPDAANPTLQRMAHTVNLYISTGVVLNRLNFGAIAFGPATVSVLGNTHYRKCGFQPPRQGGSCSRGGTLSAQEAWDAAYFMDSHERPQDPRVTGSVAETREKYRDTPMSLYGLVS